jgi:hypothetical protein
MANFRSQIFESGIGHTRRLLDGQVFEAPTFSLASKIPGEPRGSNLDLWTLFLTLTALQQFTLWPLYEVKDRSLVPAR